MYTGPTPPGLPPSRTNAPSGASGPGWWPGNDPSLVGDDPHGGGVKPGGDVPEWSPYYGGTVFSGSGGLGTLDPYTAAMMGMRGAGGTGGGSAASEGNMDSNDLIALSQFLGENVTSFAGGGKMHNPYKYDNGGRPEMINNNRYWKNLVNQSAAINQISNIINANKANKGMKMRKRYTQGGRF